MHWIEEIKLTETGILPPLIRDYLEGNQSLQPLYQYPPSLASFAKAINDKKKDITDRKLLVEVLSAQYSDLPVSTFVKENIGALNNLNTFTVTAAHQPCLFLGPLYNIWKIAGTIHLSRQLKQAYPDYHFVPLFWMGSEDHDVEEVNHVFFKGKRVEWEGEVSGPVGRIPSTVMTSVLDDLKNSGVHTGIWQTIESGLSRYSTFGKFTQYLINELFKEYGLLVLDADNAKLKQKFATCISDEIFHQRAEKVLSANLEFLNDKYKIQAAPREINFFYMEEKYRERIIYNASTGKFDINNTTLSFTSKELQEEIKMHPQRFSPNVIFRPLYQEFTLPNIAFTGGSGELSYWLELKPLFDYYKVNYPILLQRGSAAILSASVQNKLKKLGMKGTQFFEDSQQLIKQYVKEHTTADTSLEEEKKRVEDLFDAVTAKAELIEVTLKQSAAAEKQKTINSLTALEAKMLKAEKRNQEVAVNQILAVKEALFPAGHLQERTEGFLAFYNEHFIEQAVEMMNPLDKTFKFLAEE